MLRRTTDNDLIARVHQDPPQSGRSLECPSGFEKLALVFGAYRICR